MFDLIQAMVKSMHFSKEANVDITIPTEEKNDNIFFK